MNRYSFTGKGSILIKAGAAGTYGNKVYEADEPISYLTEVLVSIAFSSADKVAKQGLTNLAADSSAEPAFLTVQNIKTSESLQSLLYKKQTSSTKNKTIVKKLVSDTNSLFLPIQTGEILTGQLFIYTSSGARAAGYTLDSGTGEITGLVDGTYTIFYSITKSAASTYFLDTPKMPYVAAEIIVQGNLNNTTGEVVIHFDRLKILSKPTLNFNNEAPFVDTLEFAVINDKELVEINYYG